MTTEHKSPPCRICGKTAEVYVWRDEAPEQTICFSCCDGGAEHHDGETGHHFSFAPLEGHSCDYCGAEVTRDWPRDWGGE